VTRDRDAAGRARNSRPRDALGRPLDRAQAGDERIPDNLVLAGPAAAALADQLLRAGRPFHAHEVLEASWKSGPAGERDLWQGLAQIAVGLTHAHRGNARGAVTLLRRGVERVRGAEGVWGAQGVRGGQGVRGAQQVRGGQELAAGPAVDPDCPYGMDIAAFLGAAESLATRIERDGLSGIAAADLCPGLRPG
jgi:hypothetical protein